MNVLWSVPKYIRDIYKEINPATLTGAIDVIVVEQENGDLSCSPFHVRFGKMGVLRSREKVVDIAINEEDVEVQMKLGDSGEAFFVEPIPENERTELPSFLATSPIPNSLEIMTAGLNALRLETAKAEAQAKAQLENQLAFNHQESQQKMDFSPSREKSSSHNDLSSYGGEFQGVQPTVRPSHSLESLKTPNEAERDVIEIKPDPEHSIDQNRSISLQAEQETFYDSCDDEHLINVAADHAVRRKRLNRRVKKSVLLARQLNRKNRGPLLPSKNHTWNGELSSATIPKSVRVVGCSKDSADPNLITNGQAGRKIAKNEPRRFSMSYAEGELMDNSAVDDDHIFSMEISDSEEKRSSRTGRKTSGKILITMAKKNFSTEDSVAQGISRSLPSTRLDMEYSTLENPQLTVMDVDGHEQFFNGIGLAQDTTDEGMKNPNSIPIGGNIRSCFSDTDITPPPSPTRNRPPSPVSDTEVDKVNKHELKSAELMAKDEGEWKWGELPDVAQKQAALAESEQVDGATGWSRMFGFGWQRKTKTVQQAPEGIYLDDLIKSEPQTAALYLAKSKDRKPSGPTADSTTINIGSSTDEIKTNVEAPSAETVPSVSAQSDSQPIPNGRQSPSRDRHVSADSNDPRTPPLGDDPGYDSGSKPSSIGADDHHRRYFFDESTFNDLLGDISLSLCGGISSTDKTIIESQFQSRLVTYDQFQNNPDLLSNQDLVVKVNDKYYTWKVAGPIILSALAFHQPLSQATIKKLMDEHMPIRKSSAESQRSYSWFSWRARPTSPEQVKSDSNQVVSIESGESHSDLSSATSDHGASSALHASITGAHPLVSITEVQSESMIIEGGQTTLKNVTITESTRLSSIGSEESFEDLDDSMDGIRNHDGHRYRKTLRLTSGQLKKLKLKPGPNEARFSVTTKYQGTSWCSCHIYLWRFDDKIVISDIDGTITKSDVLGQILPLVGSQWAQAGVTKLFTRIAANGYKLVYLSARAIGQSALTKGYLRSVCQDQLSLPEGPLLLSPTSLMNALHREVIEKKPEEFKIKALNDVRALFPKDHNPFYAGYGNKINDVWAYTAVNVPRSRIFVINPKGEVHQHERKQVSSSTYTRIAVDLVDHMFPPLSRPSHPPTPVNSNEKSVLPSIQRSQYAGFTPAEDFSSFTYWYHNIDDSSLDLDKFKPTKDTQRAKPSSNLKEFTSEMKSGGDHKQK